MNFWEPSPMAGAGNDEDPSPSPSRNEVQLQGPRPSPLQVNKNSHKILKKPPLPKPTKPLSAAVSDADLRPQPVIIYAVSPKIIYANVDDFMNVVQRHTGNPSLSSDDLISAGDISPAARFASIENINNSPSDRNRRGIRIQNQNREPDQVINLVDDEGLPEMSQNPAILSPAPASLSRMWAEFFSPTNEQQAANNSTSNNNINYYSSSVFNDFSPNNLLQGISFASSPGSYLFSAPIFSPTLSFYDFDNF